MYRDFFSMYVSLLEYGDNADVPREDMEKLIHIAQQEEEFWEKGAPFDEFAAYFQEGHQLSYAKDGAVPYGETLGAYFPEIPDTPTH